MKKILICGLPGTGKTTLAKELTSKLKETGKTVSWFNADSIREKFNDWDFSLEGRLRQTRRMKDLAEDSPMDFVICDFVAPIRDMRDIFAADYTIWMNTETASQYNDTDKIFEKPSDANFVVKVKDAKNIVIPILKDIV